MRKGPVSIGIAAGLIAIVLLLAWAASASATRTVFCQENVGVCPEAKQYPAQTWVTTVVEAEEVPGTYSEIIIPGLTTVSCAFGKVSGSASVQKEGPLTGYAVFSNPPCSPEGCSFYDFTEPTWELEATGGGDGAIVISNPLLKVVCTKSPNITCEYGAPTVNAEFEGGPPGEAFLTGEETALELKAGGLACNLYKKATLRFRTQVREPMSASGTYLTN